MLDRSFLVTSRRSGALAAKVAVAIAWRRTASACVWRDPTGAVACLVQVSQAHAATMATGADSSQQSRLARSLASETN